MRYFIKAAPNVDEWAILEFQGKLRLREGLEVPPKFDYIGDLHYNKQGKPVMMIGHHMLQGEQLVMDKPIAVTEQRTKKDKNGKKITVFQVKAIVKKKLLFCDRPKPIVVSAPKANGTNSNM